MNSAMPVKKVSMMPFFADFPKSKQPKVTFESLPKQKFPNRLFQEDLGRHQLDLNVNKFKSTPSLLPSAKSLQSSSADYHDDEYKTKATLNTRLDLPRDEEDYDLEYTPYEYSFDELYGERPQTSYLSASFASRNRALESIAECLTPSSSSASSRGGDVTPEYNQILDVKREKVKSDQNENKEFITETNAKQLFFPKIQQERQVTPVKVKPVLSLRNNERLPSLPNNYNRLETSETFLAHSRLVSQNRSESVESIRTPSTSRHLLWSRGSIMSDGGFSKNRSDSNITKLSFQSEPTPTVQSPSKNGRQKKKARKHRRKAATKFYVPYQSFLDSVKNNTKPDEKTKAKKIMKSANFTLYFPSIQKKCTITPVGKDGKWCSK